MLFLNNKNDAIDYLVSIFLNIKYSIRIILQKKEENSFLLEFFKKRLKQIVYEFMFLPFMKKLLFLCNNIKNKNVLLFLLRKIQ